MTRIEYEPKTDCLRLIFRRWTDDTYPVQSGDGVLMIDHGEIVGILTPRYLASLLEPLGIELPIQHADRTAWVKDSLLEDSWLSYA